MGSERRELPEGRKARVRLDRVSLVGIERICTKRSGLCALGHERGRTVFDRCVVYFGAMDHGHAAWVKLEHVVDERDDGDDSCGRSRKGEACETLDKGSDEGGGKVAAESWVSSCGTIIREGRTTSP